MEKYLKIINQNSYRILKLVNNISDDNRIDLGHSKDVYKRQTDVSVAVARLYRWRNERSEFFIKNKIT